MISDARYWMVFLTSCFFYASPAQVPTAPMKDPAAFRLRLEAMSSQVNAIESDFTQVKELSVLAGAVTSKGHFCYRKENNIRWEYMQPYRYLIIISQQKIFIKAEDNHKQYDMQSNKMFQEMNKFISGCIQGDILKNEKEYRIKYFEDDKSYFVSLVPVSEKMRQMLNEVQIWFNRSDLTVTRIKMVETGGDYTKIDFTNKKLNSQIPLERFSFK
jgi:outer membrane lipoprotein-sorting protein